jgi:hypothetical protein
VRWPMPNIEPRWRNTIGVAPRLQFLGQAGPLDLWLEIRELDLWVDPKAQGYLYCFMWAPQRRRWAADAAAVIEKAKYHGVHLTLHDECMIYQVLESHMVRASEEREDA